jgi:hypothetical protein
MPRNFWSCPVCKASIVWAYTGDQDDDPGLTIALHVKLEHPEIAGQRPTLETILRSGVARGSTAVG